MNIWQFQFKLTRRLLIWSFLSMTSGVFLQIKQRRFFSSMGLQFLAWGFIDALIAMIARRAANKREARLAQPLADEVTARESRSLSNILWINTGLDIGYVIGGCVLALTKGKNKPGWRGHGIGIFLQGTFLFFFDLFHTFQLRSINQRQPGAPKY